MKKIMKKATKKSFEKFLMKYLENLDENEKKIVAAGTWHIWRASCRYKETHYGDPARHRDIKDIALIAYNYVIM